MLRKENKNFLKKERKEKELKAKQDKEIREIKEKAELVEKKRKQEEKENIEKKIVGTNDPIHKENTPQALLSNKYINFKPFLIKWEWD